MPFILIAALYCPTPATGQKLAAPSAIPVALSRFEPHPGERPVYCEVQPIKPALNFALRLQAGYLVTVPMSQYPGAGHILTVVARVAPENKPPVYLAEAVRLPPAPATHSAAAVRGSYLLGEGRYTASLVVQDEQGGVCRKEWQVEASLGRRGRKIKLEMPPGAVRDLSLRGPQRAAPVRDHAAPVRLTVMLHAAPQTGEQDSRSVLTPEEQTSLLGTITALVERLPAASVRLVMFNLEEQKEILRRDNVSLDDLDDVADAMKNLKLGTVDYRLLRNPNGKVDLVAGLVNREMRAEPPPDAVVFLGQRQQPADKISRAAIEQAPGRAPQFFYLQCIPGTPRLIERVESDPDLPSDGWDDDDTLRPDTVEVLDTNLMADLLRAEPDTISRIVEKVNGRTLAVHSPVELAKAIAMMRRRIAQK